MARRIVPVLKSAKKSWPPLDGSPQRWQKAVPVIPCDTGRMSFGSTGLCPSWFVLRGAGGGEVQVADGPQP